ncbi:type VII secretion integral membrane protein EccD [Mycobacterium sherrisii]|uniref:type VII secretion integral membrane protein EccD n=1 Tax=Mycobacterium sherrisii TaxID=243061 RepID=UPI002DDD6E5A|nr:type VII secretion integral membrane protein EccD [Mycobacterium sherrisii]MEC4764906.1 type VII secretion integral membrane protein EccD [Mycobacterium sherrisii]
MTAIPQTAPGKLISAASEQVRVSVLCNKIQADVVLPIDVPIAALTPKLVKLTLDDADAQSGASDDPFANEAKHNVWVLSRFDDSTPLSPVGTLRDADITEGTLLRLTARRALTPPTLHDDVVDAAARLNKSGHPAWDAAAARWMTFLGVHLASAVWVYFLLADVFAANRAAMVGLSLAVASVLTGAATLAHRSYQQPDAATALGWAVLPIAAAVAWVGLHGLGGYGWAAGCAVMVALSVMLLRIIGTGHWGYLAVGTAFGLTGISVTTWTAGLRADLAGAGLASVATLGCLAVHKLDVRRSRVHASRHHSASDDVTIPPGAEHIWADLRAATLTRSAIYTGLAVSAGLGTLAVLGSTAALRWPALIFALSCAAALGLYSRRPVTAEEKSGLVIPAAAVAVLSCSQAHAASPPMPLIAWLVLLTTTMVVVLIGLNTPARKLRAWPKTVSAYLTYLITAALIPLAIWVVGGYERLGIR